MACSSIGPETVVRSVRLRIVSRVHRVRRRQQLHLPGGLGRIRWSIGFDLIGGFVTTLAAVTPLDLGMA